MFRDFRAKLTFILPEMKRFDAWKALSRNIKANILLDDVPELFESIGEHKVADGIVGVGVDDLKEISSQCDAALREFFH
jgi:hypothetical protein